MSQKIVINFKVSTGATLQVEIELSANVGQLKAQLAESSKIPAAQQRLIFAGHVLKDHEIIENLGIKDGYTVHLVKGAAPSINHDPNQSSASTSASTNLTSPGTSTQNAGLGGLGAFGGLGGLGGLGGDMSSLQQQMMQDPDMMNNLMNNPMVQSMMSNPEFIRSMIQSNPQLRQVIERNPEIGHALNDPGILRQTMQLMQNPQLMREMQRNTDRAMSNIEIHPEGFNALRRMYTQVQEPIMESTSSMYPQPQESQSNPFANIFQSPDPNTAPLPNPWAPASNSSSTSTASSSAGSSAGSSSSTTGQNTSSTTPFAGLGSFPMFPPAGSTQAVPGQQQTPLGLPSGFDLDSYSNLLSNPMIQSMMQQTLSDPNFTRQLLQSNPTLQQMSQSNPQLAEALTNPQLLQQLMQPQTLQAISQLQSAMNQLQGIFPTQGTTPSTSFPSTSTPQASTGGANPFMFPFLTPQQSAPVSNIPPEQRFSEQLATLRDMGFTDNQANIEALTACNGNVNLAVERLLSRS